MAILLYLPSLRYGYVYDDWYQLVYNNTVQTATAFSRPFLEPTFPGDLYRPLTVASYLIAWAGGPLLQHSINIILYALCCALVPLVAKALGAGAQLAAVAALLFAVHPLHVEVVANIVGRAELLAALGVIGALLAGRWWMTTGYSGGLIVAICAALIGLFAKESALCVILLMPLVMLPGQWRSCRGLGLLAGLSGASLLFIMARHQVLQAASIPSVQPHSYLENPLMSLPWPQRLLPSLEVWGHGISALFLPLNLMPDYSVAEATFYDSLLGPWGLYGLGVFGSLVLFLWFKRNHRLVFVGGLWILLTSLITSNLLFPIGTIRADRLWFLPSVGAMIFMAALIDSLAGRRLGRILPAVLIVWFAGQSLLHQSWWESNKRLFEVAVKRNPDSPKSWYNLGLEYFHRDRNPGLAAQAFTESLARAPRYIPAALLLSDSLVAQGYLGRAREVLRIVSIQEPDNLEIAKRLAALDIAIREVAD